MGEMLTTPDDAHGEWVERCAARLHMLWPDVDPPGLKSVAEALWSDSRSAMRPELAAYLASKACGRARPL